MTRTCLYTPPDGNRTLKGAWLLADVDRTANTSAYVTVSVGIAHGTDVDYYGEWNGSTTNLLAASPVKVISAAQKIAASSMVVAEVTTAGDVSLTGLSVQLLIGHTLAVPGNRLQDRQVQASVEGVTDFLKDTQAGDQIVTVALWNLEDETYFKPLILDADNTTVTVVSTTTETTLYSFSVPGGSVSGDRSVRCVVTGTYLNNDGAARNLTISVKYGATTLWGDLVSITNSASTYGFSVSFILSPKAEATSAQHANGYVGVFGPAGASVAGYGDIATATMRGFGGDATEDASTALVLAVTLTHETSSASLTASKFHGHVEQL